MLGSRFPQNKHAKFIVGIGMPTRREPKQPKNCYDYHVGRMREISSASHNILNNSTKKHNQFASGTKMVATSDDDERSPCDNEAVAIGMEKEPKASKVNTSSLDGAVVGGVRLKLSDENDSGDEGEDGKRSAQHVGPVEQRNSSPSEPESGDDGEETKQTHGTSTGQEEPGSETFPMKLFRMLEEIEAEGSDDIVSFVSEGRAFSIHQRKKFVSDVMPRYFATSRISSLQRQLNLYGFRRLTDGSDKGAYFHENFQKGQKKMCQNIKRKKTHPGFEAQTLRGLQPPPSSSEMLSLLQQRESVQRTTPQLGGREAFPSSIPGQEHFQASSIFAADAGVINSRSLAVAALLRRQQELDVLAASSRMMAEQPGLSTLLGSLHGSGSHHPIENLLSLSAHSESGRNLSAMEQALQHSHRLQLLNSLSQQASWPKGGQDGSTGVTQCSPSNRVQSLHDAQSMLAVRGAQQLANANNLDMILQAAQLGQTRPNQQVVGNNNVPSGNFMDLLRANPSLMQTLSPHDLLLTVGPHVAPNASNSASDISRALQLLGDIQKARDGHVKNNTNNSQ